MSTINVNIKCSNEAKVSVSLDASSTVLQLKEAIAAELEKTSSPSPPSTQRLIFAGRVLKDEEPISTYKIIDGSSVHLVRAKAPAPAASTTSSTTAESAPPSATVPNPPNPTPTTPSAPSNPFAALLGANAGNPGIPNLDMFGAGAGGFGAGSPGAGLGAGGLNNLDPNLMANLLSNPAVASSVSAMFSNPAMMDAMIAANPQMAASMTPQMRAMMQSEGFRRMMANPEMLRSMMQMAPLMGGGANPFAQGMDGFPGAPAPGAGVAANPMNPTGANAFDPALLSLLMGGIPPAGAAARAAPPANPEEAYQEQLRQLQEMGFYDAAENIRALNATGGNVNAAVEYLFNNPPGRI
ncbi:hypothetical protein BC829DRAFT_386511 [Chytridium lagenaria]|nr:hypothetical protein BC829DRAFT_386511 [Chytridium lagenaria]